MVARSNWRRLVSRDAASLSRRVVAALAWSASLASSAFAQLQLTDVTAETGIEFVHTAGGSGEQYIVEYVASGLALFDFDGDGDLDIYFLNGAPLNGAPLKETDDAGRPRNALYRNDGGWRFTDVTVDAMVGDPGHSLGVAVGDYDNDGDLDLYVNNFGKNRLFSNQRDGTFRDVTDAAGVANASRVGAGASFLDYDADGDLDLFVANYVHFAYEKHIRRTRQGYPTFASPRDYAPDADTLFRNNGDGTFSDVSDASGIAAKSGPSMGAVCTDYDGDGDTDIFVANDVFPNFVYRNDGQGHFREAGLFSGFAYDSRGTVHGSMGVDCGDYNNDGLLDLHVTSYQDELATLYRNGRNHVLVDVTVPTKVGQGTRRPVTWGNGFVDFDNDGDLDLFIATGHLGPNVEKFDSKSSFRSANLLFENVDGSFRNVSATSGSGMAVVESSRGAVFGDLDGDGDVDGVILNTDSKPTILRNDVSNGNHWIGIRLQGKTSNRDGIGTQVQIETDTGLQTKEVQSGRGYQSHFGTPLHFGIGKTEVVKRMLIQWTGGKTQVVTEPLPAGQVHTIIED